MSIRSVSFPPNLRNVSDWLFPVSVANILFFKTWAALLEHTHIVPISFVMVMLNVLVAAVCLRVGYFIVQQTKNPFLRWAGIIIFAVLWLIPIHAITTVH